MFRIVWFMLCLFVAALLAVVCQSLIPVITSSVSPDGISHGIYDLLSRSDIVQFASGLALFGIFLTVLGLGGQVLVDGLAARRFHQDLDAFHRNTDDSDLIKGRDFLKIAAETGDLAEPCAEYVASSKTADSQPLSVPLPADRFFGTEKQINNRLHLWLFSNLHWALITAGIVLFLLAIVSGIDDMLFRSLISSQQPMTGLLRPLQSGTFAIAMTLMSALAVKLIVQFFIALRRAQTVRLTSFLDSLFLRSSGDVAELRQPLKTLSEAQVLIAEDRTEQMGRVIDQALKRLTDKLAGEFNKQVKSTSKLLEETEKQVTKSAVAVGAAHDALAKYARGQSSAIDKAIGASLNKHVKDEIDARKEIVSAVGEAMVALEKGMNASSKAAAKELQKSLETLNENYGGGLTDTAEALKQSQSDIADLVRAIEHLASRPVETHAQPGSAREDYLRLVGDDEPAEALDPIAGLDLEGDVEENAERVDRLTRALRLSGKQKPGKGGKKPGSGEKLSSALKSIKDGSQPGDLPDL
jgi:hypothetical protein